jgi:hypothetical protein
LAQRRNGQKDLNTYAAITQYTPSTDMTAAQKELSLEEQHRYPPEPSHIEPSNQDRMNQEWEDGYGPYTRAATT